MATDVEVICVESERKYFCDGGWTGEQLICLVGQNQRAKRTLCVIVFRHSGARVCASPEWLCRRRLMVRRRSCAVSNHEITMYFSHPSRRGEDAAPQDEDCADPRKQNP